MFPVELCTEHCSGPAPLPYCPRTRTGSQTRAVAKLLLEKSPWVLVILGPKKASSSLYLR